MAESKPKRRYATVAVGVVLVLALVFGVVSFIADRVILSNVYERVPETAPNLLIDYEDYAGAYPREAVEFDYNGQTLRGYVYGADNTRGLIIFRHGIFSHHQQYLPLITAMVDKGWRLFAYDAIGCGESDGDDVIGLSQSPLDVAAAIDFARESGMADGMEIALWGHSWGGYGVAGALDLRPDVDACVTMSGFDTPLKELEATSRAYMGSFAITQMPTLWLNTILTFGADANRSASQAVLESGVPTLVIHGSNDTTVPYEEVSILVNVGGEQALSENVSTLTLSEPGRSEHNSFFYSKESQAYLNECSKKLQQLLAENGDDSQAPEVVAFIDSVDKIKANTADPELIDHIDAFLASNLATNE